MISKQNKKKQNRRNFPLAYGEQTQVQIWFKPETRNSFPRALLTSQAMQTIIQYSEPLRRFFKFEDVSSSVEEYRGPGAVLRVLE